MSEEIEKAKKCAMQVSKELNYDIDETVPNITVSRRL
jgi:hypothetical protein